MTTKKLGFLAYLFLASLSLCAQADEESPLAFSGFGTLAYSHNRATSSAFLHNLTHEGDKPWLNDSRLGLQLAYQPHPQYEFVGQLVAKDQVGRTLASYIDQAYAGYWLSDSSRVRAGRVGSDLYMHTDSQQVGYASPWVRPPVEFYGQTPVYSVDGIEIFNRFSISDKELQATLQAGQGQLDISTNGAAYTIKARDYFSASLSGENQAWRARLGFSQMRFKNQEMPLNASSNPSNPSTPLPPVTFPIVGGNPTDPAYEPPPVTVKPAPNGIAAALASGTFSNDTIANRIATGAIYDDGDWLAQSEWCHRWASDKNPDYDSTGYYLLLGKRFDKLTPYFITSTTRLSRISLFNPSATTVSAAYQSQRVTQETLSLGTRWDIGSGKAFKAQWDKTRVDGVGSAAWSSTSGIPATAVTVDSFSLIFDFVF